MLTPSPDLSAYLQAIDAEMRACVQSADPLLADFYAMMRYHVGWADEHFQPAQADSGKRLRPLFCLLACEAVYGDFTPALPAAAAIEILHNFSLVHDDIEDGDQMRRHRPTLWTLVGVSHAINAGDALFALAQGELLRLSERGVPAERVLRASQIFQSTCVRLVEGQYLDMRSETLRESSLAHYLNMVGGKTAALLGAATAIGAAVATDATAQIDAWREFGVTLGMAFQMTDDVLGLWGDPAVTGKPAGADLRRRKRSLPIVLALSQDSAEGREFQRLFNQSGEFGDTDITELMRLMDAAQVRRQAEQEAESHRMRAIQWLERLNVTGGSPQALQTLRALAETLTKRDR